MGSLRQSTGPPDELDETALDETALDETALDATEDEEAATLEALWVVELPAVVVLADALDPAPGT